MKKSLTILFMVLAVLLVFVACGEPKHEHSYSAEWKYDATNHWHLCSCGEKSDVAAHKFEVVKSGEELVKKCTACEYVSDEKITGKLVLTAEELKTALSEGKTIYLGANFNLTEKIALSKSLTLDLNGKTLDIQDNTNDAVTLSEASDEGSRYTVKIMNGKITGKVKNDKNNFFALESYTGLELENVEMAVTCKRGIQIKDNYLSAKVSVKGSTLKVKEGGDGVYVIATNASVSGGETSKGITIDIDNSTLEATSIANDNCGSTALLLNVPGTYTITNSNIKGERQAAIFRGGTFSVSGSTFEYTTNHETNKGYEAKDWSSGNDVPNAAIVIGNRGGAYAYPTEVTFSGSNTLTVPTNSFQLYVYQASARSGDSFGVSRKVTVNGADSSWNVNTEKNGASYNKAE